MDRPSLTAISLCSGVGMLDIGLESGLEYLGFGMQPVAYVEREGFGIAILGDRAEQKALGDAPVYPDLVRFDGKPFRGVVDIIYGGFPCQPWSAAGQRKGTDDERWIWPDIVRIVSEVEPALCFFENVPGLISGGGLEHCLFDLAKLGFDAEWQIVSAASVGASHQRERVFILAVHRSRGFGILRQSSGCGGFADRGDEQLDYTTSPRHNGTGCGTETISTGGQCLFGEGCKDMGQPDSARWKATGPGFEVNTGHEFEPGCGELAHTECNDFGSKIKAASVGESKTERSANIAGGYSNAVADTSSPRPQGREQRGTCNTDRGGGASTWIS